MITSRTRGVMEQKGIFDLASTLRFDIVDFEELGDNAWSFIPPGASHWPDGFHIPRMVSSAEYLVTTCCLKTHGYGGVFTMSLKLSVGRKTVGKNGTRSPVPPYSRGPRV